MFFKSTSFEREYWNQFDERLPKCQFFRKHLDADRCHKVLARGTAELCTLRFALQEVSYLEHWELRQVDVVELLPIQNHRAWKRHRFQLKRFQFWYLYFPELISAWSQFNNRHDTYLWISVGICECMSTMAWQTSENMVKTWSSERRVSRRWFIKSISCPPPQCSIRIKTSNPPFFIGKATESI